MQNVCFAFLMNVMKYKEILLLLMSHAIRCQLTSIPADSTRIGNVSSCYKIKTLQRSVISKLYLTVLK
jgi:hypothetical protein